MVLRPRIRKAGTSNTPGPSLKVTQTTLSTNRSRQENLAPQVHLGHGRALFQDPATSTRPQGLAPAAGTDESFIPYVPVEPTPSRHYRKHEQQLARWNEVLPAAQEVYMEWLRVTNNLWDFPPMCLLSMRCSCCTNARELKIDVVRFDKFETIRLWTSDCNLAIVQLVQNGLFPCAPKQPMLTVDVRMLDFVSRLFLQVSPNHMAWCSAVENFL
ncbi:hypothetical protein VKT23_016609 [Stygiomarasmius scandens]|uniref:CxC1-like cysteine cluster associated with KDZ transposases domain-containing protein n=1 Tax=Marasmiellus scandens TaxID=2682957 RepID=A0ABR1IXB7_9AGAR